MFDYARTTFEELEIEMSDEILLKDLDSDGILTLTLNRPEARNPINMRMGRELGEAVRDAELAPDVRVVVITGAGNGFCSGGDFKNFGAVDPGDHMQVKWNDNPVWNDIELKTLRFMRGFETARTIHNMGKPTIAMVRGPAVGAGVGLAACCDFRVVSDNAYFLPGYIKVGISPDFGTSYFVTKIVGPAKAKELYLLNEKITAEMAAEIGFATKVVPDAELETTTLDLARRLARQAPVALRYTKEAFNAAESRKLEEVMEIEARNFARSFQTSDATEAIRATLEKREPVFKGQ
jgi:2-(1,2-epoxy-1,2-dihydrophenyl)acetyl-CoA isomerase